MSDTPSSSTSTPNLTTSAAPAGQGERLITIGTHPRANYVPAQKTAEARKADKARIGKITSYGIVNRDFTMPGLHDFLNAGNSLFAASSNGRRLNEFSTRHTATLDSDNGGFSLLRDAARAFNARTGFAVSVGETATVGNGRLNVGIDGEISDEHIYALAINFLIDQIGAGVKLDIDDASGVLSQYMLGYGRKSGEYFPGTLIPLSYLMDGIAPVLAKEAEDARIAWEREQRAIYKPIIPASSAGEAFFNKLLDKLESDLSNLSAGSNRKRACIRAMINPATYIAHFPDGEQRLIAAAVRGMTLNKAMHDHPGNEKNSSSAMWAIYEGLRHGKAKPVSELRALVGYRKAKKSVRRRLEKQDTEALLPTNKDSRKLSDAIRVQHVSDDLTADEIARHMTLLVQAPTGLGKSFAVTTAFNALPDDQTITALAQFRLLTSSLHQLLKDFAHYEQADGAHQRALGQLKRLVTSLSSLAKFDRHGGRVIADEITGVLNFLAKSGTLKGGEALTTFRALVRLLETAVQVVGMDANLDDITIRFMEAHRGQVTVKRYQRAEGRGKVTLLGDKIAAICMIGKLLSHQRGQVWAPISSETTASQVTEHFTALGYRVLKVTRDTSNTATVKTATGSADARRAYDLIVYDSSMGAGVDIPEHVYAQVAIFDRIPLAPEDAIQLLGRVRDAQRRFAAVPPDSEGYRTPSAHELLADVIKREQWTARRFKATPQVMGDMLELAQLWAQFEERSQRETARWRLYFARRLHADGFTVVENNARAPKAFCEAWKAWKDERDDQHWAAILDAAGNALPDDDLDRLRLAGTEITTDLRLRNVRWKIESAKTVSDVTDADRDLKATHGRRRLFHLRDWFSSEDDLHAVDQAQAAEESPIYRRRYSTLTHEAVVQLFKLMGHDGTPEQQLMGFIDTFRESISSGAVEARYGMITSPEAMRLFKLLGHYGNNAMTPTGLCRWLLVSFFGLKLNSHRHRVNGKLTMFYQIDAETLDYRLDRARTAARNRERVIRNVYSSLKYTKVISFTPPQSAPPMPRETGIGFNSAEGESELIARMAALMQPVGKGY